MMRESEAFYTRESLAAAIMARFGSEARFHTCSTHALNAIQLVEFLSRHGKIKRNAGGFVVNLENVCQTEKLGAA